MILCRASSEGEPTLAAKPSSPFCTTTIWSSDATISFFRQYATASASSDSPAPQPNRLVATLVLGREGGEVVLHSCSGKFGDRGAYHALRIRLPEWGGTPLGKIAQTHRIFLQNNIQKDPRQSWKASNLSIKGLLTTKLFGGREGLLCLAQTQI
jgi:hypothetical protein